MKAIPYDGAAETTTAMLDKISAGVVIVDENLKVIESNRAFVNMLGEDARMIDEMIPGLKAFHSGKSAMHMPSANRTPLTVPKTNAAKLLLFMRNLRFY
jgi:sensor histidine kinase regulating citrate/malate metabolism